MIEWSIVKGPHTYRYICVGTATGSSSEQQGRLLIYSLKRASHANESSKIYEFKTVWIAELPSPVYRVCSFLQSHLLVSSGKTVYVYQLNMEQRKLVKVCKEDMRFPITKIAAYNDHFVVGCQRISFSLFKFDIAQSRIVFKQSDRHPRMPIECIMGNQCLIGTDQSGHIIGLAYKANTIEESLNTVFSIKQPDMIWRIQPGSIFHPILEDTYTTKLDWPISTTDASTSPKLNALMGASCWVRFIYCVE
ncbi:CPSF A subunit region-domain-containing protein [Syncephalis fuscata]|nr:CPSF A subunit region-domain-containing protein [Syncephalis fuscata]